MKFIASKAFILISCALFMLVGSLLIPVYKYQINPDGIAYLSIARHYADGRWMNALNSCWPPLYSWMIAPLLYFTDEPLWVAKMYNVLSGAGCLWISLLLLRHYRVRPLLQLAAVVLFFGTYLMWAFGITTPDLLSVFIMLIYAYLVVTDKFLKYPLLTGLVGAIAYFTKSYCFFFFAAHLSFSYFLSAVSVKAPLRVLIRKYLLSIVCFLLLSFSWMYILSFKYDKITISSASAWTHGMIKYKNLDCIEQIIAPPHAQATFAWEDPPAICPHKDWNIFGSFENIVLQATIIYKNSNWFVQLQKETGFFHFAGFFLILFMTIFTRTGGRLRRKTTKEIVNDPLFFIIPFTLIYTFGYLLIFIEPRYVWIGYVLITIGFIASLDRIINEWQINPRKIAGFLLVMMIVLLSTVLIRSQRMLVPLQKLTGSGNVTYKGFEFYKSSQALKVQSPTDSRMACIGGNRRINRTQSWNLAYYAGWKHYGMLPDKAEIAEQLINQHNIRILTVADSDSLPGFLRLHWERIYPGAGELRVYRKK
jgi:hypothetical protein